jgi:hypothetical protein
VYDATHVTRDVDSLFCPGLVPVACVALALVAVWAGIALNYRASWPLGRYVGAIGARFCLFSRRVGRTGPSAARGASLP